SRESAGSRGRRSAACDEPGEAKGDEGDATGEAPGDSAPLPVVRSTVSGAPANGESADAFGEDPSVGARSSGAWERGTSSPPRTSGTPSRPIASAGGRGIDGSVSSEAADTASATTTGPIDPRHGAASRERASVSSRHGSAGVEGAPPG